MFYLNEILEHPLVISCKQIEITSDKISFFKKELQIGLPTINQVRRHDKNVFVFHMKYISAEDRQVDGFILVPKKVRGKLPSIIYNRGGSGEFGSIKLLHLFTRLSDFSSQGYVVFASQYFGKGEHGGDDEMGGVDIQDVLVLQKIITGLSFADEKRIGMFGASRGGMMTYMVLARVPWVKVAVVQSGLANLIAQEKYRPEMIEHFKEMFGGSFKEKQKRSALYWAEKIAKKTPLLMYHGTADSRVSVQDSVIMSKKLKKAGVFHRLVLFDGEDHFLKGDQKKSRDIAKKWFKRHL